MRLRKVLAVASLLVATSLPASAAHGWSGYHWARPSTGGAAITVYNSTTTTNTAWGTHLSKSLFGDSSNPNTLNRRGWNNSAVLALTLAAGATDSGTRSSCPAVSNAVRVCNYTYGSTGWLGLASINVVSGSTVHIAWGTSKMNDTYFASGYPETEKRHVMCQEVGHDFGLGHTSENGTSQNTCMDYYSNTSATDWKSTGPNQHDFDQLAVQAHYSGTTTKSFDPNGSDLISEGLESQLISAFSFDLNEEWQWGTPTDFNDEGRPIVYELKLGTNADGEEQSIITYVRWAEQSDRDRVGAARLQQ